jgi:hypothetical protein
MEFIIQYNNEEIASQKDDKEFEVMPSPTRSQTTVIQYTVFCQEAIDSAMEIVTAFDGGVVSWSILLAAVQSGKTDVFMLVAAELLRREIKDHVVIFSGNCETQLKRQLQAVIRGDVFANEPTFYHRYEHWLRRQSYTPFQFHELKRLIQSKITLVWGAELLQYDGPTENIAAIWEESHHASSKGNRPHKFLQKLGITADGRVLARRNVMLSVSATPFSEMADCIHYTQPKQRVLFRPPASYNSIAKMLEQGRIRGFKTMEQGLEQAFYHLVSKSKEVGHRFYMIVRGNAKNRDMIQRIARKYQVAYRRYDSSETGRQGRSTWKQMQYEPAENTCINIEQLCRMGENVKKQHVCCMLETCAKSATDTIVQGLLGRACGYSAGSDTVVVYLHDKIKISGELERYIQFTASTDNLVIPLSGNHLKKNSVTAAVVSSKNNAVAVLFRPVVADMESSRDQCHSLMDEYCHSVCPNLFTCRPLNKYRVVMDSNTQEEQRQIVSKMQEEFNFTMSRLGSKTYERVPDKIVKSLREGTPANLGSSAGVKTTDFKFWLVDRDYGNFLKEHDVVMTCRVESHQVSENIIPMTNKREVFYTSAVSNVPVV